MKQIGMAVLEWLDLPFKIAVGLAVAAPVTRLLRGIFGAVGLTF